MNLKMEYVTIGFYRFNDGDTRTLKYILAALGHAGCNVFPEQVGTCQCGVRVITNMAEIPCPACGEQIKTGVHMTYSGWATENPEGRPCEFIRKAARG